MKHKWMLGVGSGNDSYPFSNEIVWAAQNPSGTQRLSVKADISIDTKLHNYKLNHLKRTPTLAPSKTICVRSRLERHQLIVLQAPCGKWVVNYTSAYTLMLKVQPISHIHIYYREMSAIWSSYAPGDSDTWGLGVLCLWNGVMGCFQHFTIFQPLKTGKFTWVNQTSVWEPILIKITDTEHHFHEHPIGWWVPWKLLGSTNLERKHLHEPLVLFPGGHMKNNNRAL